MLTRNLASDETGTWRIVFTPEERHLYIEFKRVGRRSMCAIGLRSMTFCRRTLQKMAFISRHWTD
jgi:hypothetical protein